MPEVLREELEKKDRYLKVINNFAVDLLDCQTVNEIVWTVAKGAIASLGYEDSVVYLFDEKDEFLVQVAAHGPKNPIDLDILNPIKLKPGEGIVGHVAQTGVGEIVNDTRKDSRYLLDDDMRLSEIAVPIMHRGKVIGIIDSEHPDPNFYPDIDLEILSTIASMAGSKIMQSLYFEQLTRHQEELELCVEQRTAELAETLKEVESQKFLITERNEELLNSLNYASRIQNSILPEESFLKEIFCDHLIFYRPKDIVSGDFYWVAQQQNLLYIAVADCTGHGVPGALLSLMGVNALQHAVHEGIKDPGNLLMYIRNLIVTWLRADESKKIYDGMDIGLCIIDRENHQLSFAGANQNLLVYKSKNHTIIRGNRQSVGYYDNYLELNTSTINVESGAHYYMFSDGFKDQFGGQFGKKYKQGPFIHFLSTLVDTNSENRLEKISQEFDSWKGNNEQVDDVCVFGFTL